MCAVAASWDQRTLLEQRRTQTVLLKQTVLHLALSYVPFVRARFAAAGIDARVFGGLEDLEKLPLTMRRDVMDPKRNPDGVRALLLHGTAEAVKRFSDRSVLRRVAAARLFGGEVQQELAIEAATRPIHLHMVNGPGGRIPVGYTRDDLDLFARAGSRLASLLGLDRDDRLLNLVPFGPTLEFWGIYYMAHGVGMTALHHRRTGSELARAAGVFADAQATVVALPSDEATEFPAAARDAGIDLSALKALVAVGRSLTLAERAALGAALHEAGAPNARISVAYAPGEGRVLWGECAVPAGRAETYGFHTFPDMDVVEIVNPETGRRVADEESGEIVLTPLGFRGGGAARWRTGDLALGGLTTKQCPNCGRTTPRVGPTVVRGAWQRLATLGARRTWLDLRDAGAAAAERGRDWQVELVARNGGHELFVYVDAPAEPGAMIALYEDLARLGSAPTQIVLTDPAALEARRHEAAGPWQRLWLNEV